MVKFIIVLSIWFNLWCCVCYGGNGVLHTTFDAFNSFLLHIRYQGALVGSVFNTSYQFTLLGNDDACSEVQELVRELSNQMNITQCVSIKKMSAHALKLFGNANACATNNALFIDEQWILSLDYESRRCLLAHELTHIKQWDVARTYSVHMLLIIISASMASKGILPLVASMVSVPFILLFCKRLSEKRADYGAAMAVGKEVMQQFLKEHLTEERHDGLIRWFLSFLSDYPSKKERIDSLSEQCR